jgi:hypothetical protein
MHGRELQGYPFSAEDHSYGYPLVISFAFYAARGKAYLGPS